jgi:hypothetical protein
MNVYGNVMPSESELKYSKIIVSSKSKSLFSEKSYVPCFPTCILDVWKTSQAQGRVGKSVKLLIQEDEFRLSTPDQRRVTKLGMPDLTWYQYPDLLIASDRFKSLFSPLLNGTEEWIFLGCLNKVDYYLLNFLQYFDTFNYLESKYLTFKEFSKGISREIIKRSNVFEKDDFDSLDLPNIFYSIERYVFNSEAVLKCPIFLLPYATFGKQVIFFTQEVINIIKTNQLKIEGNIHLVYTS